MVLFLVWDGIFWVFVFVIFSDKKVIVNIIYIFKLGFFFSFLGVLNVIMFSMSGSVDCYLLYVVVR